MCSVTILLYIVLELQKIRDINRFSVSQAYISSPVLQNTSNSCGATQYVCVYVWNPPVLSMLVRAPAPLGDKIVTNMIQYTTDYIGRWCHSHCQSALCKMCLVWVNGCEFVCKCLNFLRWIGGGETTWHGREYSYIDSSQVTDDTRGLTFADGSLIHCQACTRHSRYIGIVQQERRTY